MANLYMRFPGGKKKAFTLSYDDAVEQDIKLAEIFKKHHLKCTFNLNSGEYAPKGTVYPQGQIHRRMDEEQVTKLYSEDCFEVAVHGYTHPFLEQLPRNIATLDLIKDREKLEKQFDRLVRGMAYPYGTYNDDVVESMKSVGIVYSRTVHSTHSFEMPTDWLRLNPTCHHDDEKLFELADRFLNQQPYGSSWMFYLWGHSYEFEANNNWERIEKFADLISDKEEVWYATNIEIYDYTHAYHELLFSMDMKKVCNPTAYELFFEYAGINYSIKPGETKLL